MICSCCKQLKTESDFPKAKVDKLANRCKDCQKKLSREHYLKNKSKYLARRDINRNNVREAIQKYKETTDCANCGVRYPYWVTALYSENKLSLARLVGENRMSIQLFTELLPTLTLLCANCLNIKKFKRGTKHQNRKRFKRVLFLKSNPCVDCKKEYPPEAMEFDHVRFPKIECISTMVLSRKKYNDTVFEEELTKCDVICANCHKDRTFKALK